MIYSFKFTQLFQFKEIKAAYQILSDARKRKKYDANGLAGMNKKSNERARSISSEPQRNGDRYRGYMKFGPGRGAAQQKVF